MEYRFLIEINDGYTFRNSMGVIKNEANYAMMFLTPEILEISCINSSKCACHNIILDIKMLNKYLYLDDKPSIAFPFETEEFFNTIKSIERNDGLQIYALKKENKFEVHPLSANKIPGGYFSINFSNTEIARTEINGSYDHCNVEIPGKVFTKICTNTNTVKCNNLEILGYSKEAIFQGIQPNNNLIFVVGVKEDGSDLTKEEIENLKNHNAISSVRVPINTVKALSKIHNISLKKCSKLSFYFHEDEPMKISCNIGNYGIYNIGLRSISLDK